MPDGNPKSGTDLFIVDNTDQDWKVLRYLRDWCEISRAIDVATGYFEIGSLLALDGEWQKVDQIRVLMGDEVSLRTHRAFAAGVAQTQRRLDDSLEAQKEKNDFLVGVPAIVEAIRSGKIACRVYRKSKFHAKAYITHARLEVVGASALVGSSNLTYPALTENVELNIQITGRQVTALQQWYEQYWAEAEDVTPEILRTVERHIRVYSANTHRLSSPKTRRVPELITGVKKERSAHSSGRLTGDRHPDMIAASSPAAPASATGLNRLAG